MLETFVRTKPKRSVENTAVVMNDIFGEVRKQRGNKRVPAGTAAARIRASVRSKPHDYSRRRITKPVNITIGATAGPTISTTNVGPAKSGLS
jgi:hypothetical protein